MKVCTHLEFIYSQTCRVSTASAYFSMWQN